MIKKKPAAEIKLFEQQKVRTHWDEKEEKWYFSIIDVIAILTGSTIQNDLGKI